MYIIYGLIVGCLYYIGIQLYQHGRVAKERLYEIWDYASEYETLKFQNYVINIYEKLKTESEEVDRAIAFYAMSLDKKSIPIETFTKEIKAFSNKIKAEYQEHIAQNLAEAKQYNLVKHIEITYKKIITASLFYIVWISFWHNNTTVIESFIKKEDLNYIQNKIRELKPIIETNNFFNELFNTGEEVCK